MLGTNGYQDFKGPPQSQVLLPWPRLEGGSRFLVEAVRKSYNCFPGLFWLQMTKAQVKLAYAKTKEERRL